MITVKDSKRFKVLNSENYNFVFDKVTGEFRRWGKTKEEDPQMGLPEIADIEISTICSGPDGVPCKFCYKGNTKIGTYMTIDTFSKIMDKLPKTVTQIAFGADATGESNPDMWKIMQLCRDKGIVPNITIANISDETADNLVKYCGAVAVSRYANKNFCYDSVKKLTDRGMKQINIHQLISDETYDQVLETISDMKTDPRLAKMNAIVFLSLKQKGRGTQYNPLAFDKFKSIIEFSMDAKINFGFDSCSANKFLMAVKDTPAYKQFEISAEPCESSLFSTYIDVDGKFHPCSFSPKTDLWGDEGIDVASCTDFLRDIWFNEKTVKFREVLIQGHRNCPFYKI